MSASRTVPQEHWKTCFDGISEALSGSRAELEVASLDLGDQVVAARVPLLGVTYEPDEAMIDVALLGLNHMIRHPTQVEVMEEPEGLRSVAVTTRDGSVQILRLAEPLRLAAALW